MMRIYMVICLMCFVYACQHGSVTTYDEDEKNFYVISTELVQNENSILLSIDFSKEVLSQSITDSSVFVIRTAELTETLSKDWRNLYKEVDSGDSQTVVAKGNFINSTHYQIQIDSTLSDGDYSLYVLPYVQSTEYWPLDQRLNESESAQYVYHFIVQGENVTEENITPSQNYPGVLSGDSSDDVENSSDPIEEIQEPFDWQRVLLTEVVTDPQQDFGESGDGNGIKFDGIVGTGTVGSSDEYIEVYNGSSETVDLSLWSLQMFDGTDEVQGFSDDMELYFSGGGSVQNFQSGEMLVVGNPQGSINNSVTIMLLNESDEVIDDVIIEDGNATGLEDEAVFRDESGNWMQGMATPGSF